MAREQITHTDYLSIDLRVESGPMRAHPQEGRYVAIARIGGGYLRGWQAVEGGSSKPIAVQRACRRVMQKYEEVSR